MTLRLVRRGWGNELVEALRADSSELRIVCPFIKAGVLNRLLSHHPMSIRVITRFNLADFADGVSDIAALRKLLVAGASVRGVRNLHAKVYLFGMSRAIVTSANLTEAGLSLNHEFGFVSEDAATIAACGSYFDELWERSERNLTRKQIDAWEKVVTQCRASGERLPRSSGLGDHGADAGNRDSPAMSARTLSTAPQAFVKFLGQSNNRVPLSFSTLEEIARAGCHSTLCYPASKRPTGVADDAVMFISRLTSDPSDIRIFGRAVGMKHIRGRDDATAADINQRPWRQNWPRYIRVRDPEFVAGTMSNGVSLNELMAALGSHAFAATQRNAARGIGNTNPRHAYLQQPAVELSREGFAWLNERLGMAFRQHGIVSADDLVKFD